ncbi:MAG TPA: transglutaminase domain-containing protein, partial [Ignavibacteriales bacterium]|nr:transglutaminase domain-containing protein [Ignavibacteriales bacterium]
GDAAKLKYFVFDENDFTRALAKDALKNFAPIDSTGRLELFYKAKQIFNKTIAKMSYERDPRIQADRVQYPSETVNMKGGDCEDLSVLYSSLLESVGIQTAFVDYNNYPEINHINIIFNTELSPEEARLITNNDKKYIIHKGNSGKDEVWIPVEPTSFSDFETAWNRAAELYNERAVIDFGAVKGIVKIVDVY